MDLDKTIQKNEYEIVTTVTIYKSSDKREIRVTMVKDRPNSDLFKNTFIIEGVEDNGAPIYEEESSIYSFLSKKLKIPCEGTHCPHDYDCCGNFYAGPAIITSIGEEKWVCCQSWYKNI